MKNRKINHTKEIRILSLITVTVLLLTMLLTGCAPYKYSRYIELAEYMNLQLDYNLIAVTEEDLQKETDILLDKYAKTVVLDKGEVKSGDIVNIDYSGLVDEKPFAGGAETGYDLTIGSHTFIEGFEEGLIGAVIGQTVVLNLTFPVNYKDKDNSVSALAGKEVVFSVTVNKVTRRVPPEYTDEFIKSLDNEYKTVEEYNEYLKKEIFKYKQTQEAWKTVVNNTVVIKYPDTVQKRVDEIREYYEYYTIYYGYTSFNDFCIDALGQTEEEFNRINLESARDGVKQEMISQAIAGLEKIKLTKSDLDQGYANYAEYYGYDNTQDLFKDYDKNSITSSILLNKVMEYVAKHAVVVKD